MHCSSQALGRGEVLSCLQRVLLPAWTVSPPPDPAQTLREVFGPGSWPWLPCVPQQQSLPGWHKESEQQGRCCKPRCERGLDGSRNAQADCPAHSCDINPLKSPLKSPTTSPPFSASTCAYLGIQDARLHPGHPLVLPEQLDLADLAELGQHRGEVGLQVNDVADAVPGSHQQGGGWLLLILVAQTDRQGSANTPQGGTWLPPWSQASVLAAWAGPGWLW